MTIEEKAKAYNEAIERAKVFKEHLLEIDEKDYADEMDYIFPALKETEGEKIRKTLVAFFTDWHKTRSHCWGISVPKILAWLEKQGEQKPAWSEEDEKKRKCLIKGLEDRMGFGWASDPFSREELINWLKSLRPKNTWKPSESDIFFLERIANGKYNPQYFQASLGGLIEQLKKLRKE